MKYILTLIVSVMLFSCEGKKKEFIYMGTFSNSGSEGIYSFLFDRENLTLTPLDTIKTPESPSFIEFSLDKKHLYSVNRGGVENHPESGSISTFEILEDGRCIRIDERSTYGSEPCHVSVSEDNQWLYVSHYTDGSFSVFPINSMGNPDSLFARIEHQGSGPNINRQSSPHIHSIQQVPGLPYFAAADLGIDKVKFYEIKDSQVLSAPVGDLEVTPGGGPRHFDFLEGTDFIYVVEEMLSSVSVFEVDYQSGNAQLVQCLKTIPDSFAGSNSCADIHFDPDGRFLYISNRGHNSIAIFQVDKTTGELALKGHQPTLGETPRNFVIDPTGEFLMVANQNSNNQVLFRRDKHNGLLSETGLELNVPAAVCLKWRE